MQVMRHAHPLNGAVQFPTFARLSAQPCLCDKCFQRGEFLGHRDWRRMNQLLGLLVLNLLLQIFDGIATAQGLQIGIYEGNRLLAAAFSYWGVGLSLVVFKTFACSALVFVYAAARQEVARRALTAIAVVYCTCSLGPWLIAFLAVLR